MGTPKISPERLTQLIKQALEKLRNVLYSDLELFKTVNKQLPFYDRITYRTYKRYKAAAMAYGEDDDEVDGKFNPKYAELFDILIDVNIEQKINLHQQMMEAEGNKWTRYSCILEKKFPEYNQRYMTEKFIREEKEVEEMAAARWPTKETHKMGHINNNDANKNKEDKGQPWQPPQGWVWPIVDNNGVDWTAYVQQQIRKGDAEMRGEPFTEEMLPLPAPLTSPMAKENMGVTVLASDHLDVIDDEEAPANTTEDMPNENILPSNEMRLVPGNEHWGTTAEEETAHQLEKQAFMRAMGRDYDIYNPAEELPLDDEDEFDEEPYDVDDDRNIFGISRKDILVIDADALMQQFNATQQNMQKAQPEHFDNTHGGVKSNPNEMPPEEVRRIPTPAELASNPWLKPDGTIKTDEEFKADLAASRPTMFPHRKPEAPKAEQKYPPGIKKIKGIQ